MERAAPAVGTTLRDQGYRFCLRPDRQEARWLHPADKAQFHPDWIDVTDWEDSRLLAFITGKPLPHGRDECTAAQLDIFNDSGAA